MGYTDCESRNHIQKAMDETGRGRNRSWATQEKTSLRLSRMQPVFDTLCTSGKMNSCRHTRWGWDWLNRYKTTMEAEERMEQVVQRMAKDKLFGWCLRTAEVRNGVGCRLVGAIATKLGRPSHRPEMVSSTLPLSTGNGAQKAKQGPSTERIVDNKALNTGH